VKLRLDGSGAVAAILPYIGLGLLDSKASESKDLCLRSRGGVLGSPSKEIPRPVACAKDVDCPLDFPSRVGLFRCLPLNVNNQQNNPLLFLVFTYLLLCLCLRRPLNLPTTPSNHSTFSVKVAKNRTIATAHATTTQQSRKIVRRGGQLATSPSAGRPSCVPRTFRVAVGGPSAATADDIAGTVTHCVATAGSVVVTVTNVVEMLFVSTFGGG